MSTPYEILIKHIDADIVARYSKKVVKIFIAIQQGMSPPLIFLRYERNNGQSNKERGVYRCFCGAEFTAKVLNVKQGNTRSCGCYRDYTNSVRMKAKKATEGLETSSCPTKRVWLSLDKNDVVPRWLSFKDFLEDMYFMPSPNDWRLKRRDPLKRYGPENCYWERKKPIPTSYLEVIDIVKTGQVSNRPPNI